MPKNTIFNANADFVHQMTGGQPIPGYTGPATTGAGNTPVYATTIDLSPFIAVSRFIVLTTTSAGSSTVTTTNVPPAGAQLDVIVNQYTGGSAAITFSTGFRPNGTVTPNSATAIVVQFVSNGTAWCEVGRSGASV